MTDGEPPAILTRSPVRVEFGHVAISRLGELARGANARCVLLVGDRGVLAAGHLDRAAALLDEAGAAVTVFVDAGENPTTANVDTGLAVARSAGIDVFVAVGGGSVMDCAKAINLLLTNGGTVRDYHGTNRATCPMRPMIAVPTTTGTGSEAQSYAIISDAATHEKMACGDRRHPADGGLRPIVALLDPQLALTQPRRVAAATGLDAISHAVESAGCRARNDVSLEFSEQAWRLLSRSIMAHLTAPNDATAGDMLLGAHLAGCAIEESMLGAAHACANPLTAVFSITHGVAVATMLPHVVAFNAALGWNPYSRLVEQADELVRTIGTFNRASGIIIPLAAHGVTERHLPDLARMAAQQWTAGFNPRTVGEPELLELLRRALHAEVST